MKQQLRQALSSRQTRNILDPNRVRAAVLVPIYYKHGQPHILLIKRTDKVKTHKGQISFPGGAYEEQDGMLLGTALRESAEEIGLAPHDIEVIGRLDDELALTSDYLISPFVGFIPWPYNFRISREEVEELVEVPVPALLNHDCVRQDTVMIKGEAVTSYFFDYQGRIIWGATARILHQFLAILAEAREIPAYGAA